MSRADMVRSFELKYYSQEAIEKAFKEILQILNQKDATVGQREQAFRQSEKLIEETLRVFPLFAQRPLPEVYQEVIKADKIKWFLAWGFTPQPTSNLISAVLFSMHRDFNLTWNQESFDTILAIHNKYDLGHNSVKTQMQHHMNQVFSIDKMTEINNSYLALEPHSRVTLHYLYLKNVLSKFYGFKKKDHIMLIELEEKYSQSIRYVLTHDINHLAGLNKLKKICPGDPVYQAYIKTVLLEDSLHETLKEKRTNPGEKKRAKI